MSTETPKMQYVRFGNTGLRVSKICLGCMSFGSSKWSPWVKEEEESIQIIRDAYDAGINFFDTADTYSNGQSEVILGKALREIGAPRGRIVVATKVFAPVHKDVGRHGREGIMEDPELVNGFGLSRKHILDGAEDSLKRLGLDYIDLYQIHRLDLETPAEEIMEALNDLVRSGKVRYIGASSMPAWQFQKLNAIAERKGWTKFVSMQNVYNLLYREEEREMIPYCLDAGIAGIPWSPLAMGALAGKNRKTTRATSSFQITSLAADNQKASNDQMVDRVAEIAEKRNKTSAQIALAWLYTKKYVTSPIVGVSKKEHLIDLLGAMDIKLSEEEVQYLEEPYTPRPIYGY
ncbi:NADP-dependent oxidoreductase domain-containing protein [Mucor mucedo]|uniref:NADP-dependent oxidoreductase domain-containing protein n=1 Tax=Mucor mucedo TaxID=29922 RepID=UPI00221EF58E|nr:NADP-dependent oxidoreductase domain-containing protein [Mucor mucedo]KAI7892011.1 NADP-dependent oxidoreductase domain-containing protein [Mucor mucedo]